MAKRGKLWKLLMGLCAAAPSMSGWTRVVRECTEGSETYRGIVVSRFRIKGILYCLLILVRTAPEGNHLLLWGLAKKEDFTSDGTPEFPAITKYTVGNLKVYEHMETLYDDLRRDYATIRHGVAEVGRERIRAAAESAEADRLLIQGYCGEPAD